MRYWDTSALVPLLAPEGAYDRMRALLYHDPQIATWWGTQVEITSALARRERERTLTAQQAAMGAETVRQLSAAWQEILPNDAVRRTAERLLRTHPLRAADSLQLAAALIAADHDPTTLEFVCLDMRLATAARIEGFPVVGG